MKTFCGILLFLCGIVIILYIRFTNIDMTETRLLVEFWSMWVVVLILGVGGIAFLNSDWTKP